MESQSVNHYFADGLILQSWLKSLVYSLSEFNANYLPFCKDVLFSKVEIIQGFSTSKGSVKSYFMKINSSFNK